jgi:hypothetical protein
VVGRIMTAAAVHVGQRWMWTLAFKVHEDCTPDARLCADARGGGGGIREKIGGGSERKPCPL